MSLKSVARPSAKALRFAVHSDVFRRRLAQQWRVSEKRILELAQETRPDKQKRKLKRKLKITFSRKYATTGVWFKGGIPIDGNASRGIS